MNSILELKKRSKLVLIFFVLGSIIVSIKLAHLQFVKGPELSAKAEEQINSSRGINSKRGTIYDSTEKNILAQSSTVYTITVNPINIKKEDKEKVARMFVEVFDLNYDKVLKSVNKRSSIEYIVKKVEKEKTDKVRMWMAENNILTGINIDEDTKRYYPYSNLASQVIGFCGSDNQGLDGIEAKYDDILTGKKGSIEKATDAKGNNFGTEGEKYVDPIDGNNIVLSIDMTVQSIVEKYLEEACIDNVCTDGGNVIVMNPKNGDILAMATYPGYDLNSPYEITDENLKSLWNDMEQGEKNKALQALWRNKAIADTYEPGSTFKLVTASAAIEEGLANSDNAGAFGCSGSIEIAGVRIKCWRYYRPHGSQSLRQALMNSCNPVFIGLGQKLGVKTYYKYLEKFGFLQKTGIDLPGEAGTIMHKKENMGNVELATVAFGQSFQITPMQLLTTAASIINGGNRITPHFGMEALDAQGNVVENFKYPVQEGIVSEKTSATMRSILEMVVSEGTGKNGKIEGFRIGGKTATSQTLPRGSGRYIASYVGFAPADNPQVIAIAIVNNPQGVYYGGQVAAPIVRQLFENILPYLGIMEYNQ